MASDAHANYSCSGHVTGVTVSPQGTVAAASVGSLLWVYFCQMGATTNGVGPEACKAVYATLLAAQTTGKQVQLWFSDSLTCSTHPSWAWLSGWYWGPMLQ